MRNMSSKHWRRVGRDNFAALGKFAQRHEDALQTIGIVSAAAATGAVVAVVTAKSVILSQALLAAKGALAATGLMVKGAAVTPVGLGLAGLTPPLSGAGAGLSALVVGAAGGGLAGWGLTQNGVRKVTEQVKQQAAKTSTLQEALTGIEATVQQVQSQLTSHPLAVAEPLATDEPLMPAAEASTADQPPLASIEPAAILRIADQLAEIHGLGPVDAGHRFHAQEWSDEAQQPVASNPPLAASDLVQPTITLALDRLDALDGLTPAFAHSLNRAGILTYAELAALTPAQGQEIVGGSSTGEVSHWIAQAQTLAAQYAAG